MTPSLALARLPVFLYFLYCTVLSWSPGISVGNPFPSWNISGAAAVVACMVAPFQWAQMPWLLRLSQGCAFRLFPPVSNTRLLCVGFISPHPHPPSMPPFPQCLPPDGLSLKFSVRAAAAKAEPRLNIARVSWRSVLNDGSWETERAKAKLWQQKKKGKKKKNVGIEWVDVRAGGGGRCGGEHRGAREASVTSAERQDADEKRQC